MKEENSFMKQIKDHIINRVTGWKNMKIPDCTTAELFTKLMLTVSLKILVIYSIKKSYSLVTEITKKVRHREKQTSRGVLYKRRS